MRAKAGICMVVGHHWMRPHDDVHEAYPVFECARCGRRQELAPGTSTPFEGRVGAKTGADRAVGPFGPRR
jgi:hypothetical protein